MGPRNEVPWSQSLHQGLDVEGKGKTAHLEHVLCNFPSVKSCRVEKVASLSSGSLAGSLLQIKHGC